MTAIPPIECHLAAPPNALKAWICVFRACPLTGWGISKAGRQKKARTPLITCLLAYFFLSFQWPSPLPLGPNLENQRISGCSEAQIQLMLHLCKDANKEIVRNAALALSLTAYCQDNVDRMGQMEGCITTLVDGHGR